MELRFFSYSPYQNRRVSMNYGQFCNQCDALLKAGDLSSVAKKLTEFSVARVPREWRLPLANLARRAGQVTIGLKILSPLMQPDAIRKPDSKEMAEYAILLQRCGAVRDALRWLKEVDTRQAPEALLYKAFCLFNRWDYAAGIEPLQHYIPLADGEYSRLVGRVNLAAAFVHTRQFAQARELLKANLSEAAELKATRLEANCREMLAQVYIHTGSLDVAEALLGAAKTKLSGAVTVDQIFIHTWTGYLSSMREGNISALLEARQLAKDQNRAESVREIDLLSLKVNFEEAKFHHLYFGTPYPEFRKHMVQFLGVEPQAQEYLLGSAGGEKINLHSGKSESGLEMPKGGKIHQLFAALARDFYRPQSTGALFSELCPDQHFDIYSSPLRIRQIVHRARTWAETENIPLRIENARSGYSLKVEGELGLVIDKVAESVEPVAQLVTKLKAKFANGDSFSAKEAQTELNVTPAIFRRVLKTALESGVAEKFGASTNTVYFIRVA